MSEANNFGQFHSLSKINTVECLEGGDQLYSMMTLKRVMYNTCSGMIVVACQHLFKPESRKANKKGNESWIIMKRNQMTKTHQYQV